MVAAVTHELRTPLQAIMGFTQLAMMDWPSGVEPRYLRQIEQATRLMLNSVNDLLDLTHLERGTLQIEPDQAVNLGAVFEQLQATADCLRQDKGLTLHVAQDTTCPRHLRGDGKRLQQVLMNLLANAIRFTDRGRVTLQHKVMARDEGHVTLRLLVSDTGIGMSAQDLHALMSLDGDHALATRRNGTGFGLRIVRYLLDLMGSRLQGVSVPGGGTLLWFDLKLPYLPDGLVSEREPVPAQDGLHSLPGDPILHGMQVLVVEDNTLNRVVLCDFLHRLGVVTEAVVDVQHAKARLVAQRFDALISDMHLPDASGVSLLRWVRQQGGALASLPTLFLSAHVGDLEHRSAKSLSAQACLIKPHDPHDMVRHLVAMRHQARPHSVPSRHTSRTVAGLEALSGVNLRALFLSEWPSLRMEIQRADTVECLRKAVHAVRGSLAVLGQGPALELARALEEALLQGQEPEGARAHLITTIDAFETPES